MIHVIVVAVLMTLVVVPALIAAVSVPNHLRASGWERNPRQLDRRCQPDPIEREALRLARQEIAEIEWQAGLIPKPAHLREAPRVRFEPVAMKMNGQVAYDSWWPRS